MTRPWRRRRRFGLGIAPALMLLGGQSLASPASWRPESQALVVLPPSCDTGAFSLSSFIDSLRVELSGRGPWCCSLADAERRPPADAALQLGIDFVPCTADGNRVKIVLYEQANARTATRDVSLADVATSARPRALALVVAELIRSFAEEPPAQKHELPSVARSRPPAEEQTPKPRSGATPALSLSLQSEIRSFPSRSTTLWGGRAHVVALANRFYAALDVGGDLGHRRVPPGNVLFRSASLGLSIGPRLATSVVTLGLGVRGELGWAHVGGDPSASSVSASSGSNFVVGTGLRLWLEGPPSWPIRPSVSAEAGEMLRRLDGEVDHHAVAGLNGYYLVLALGLAL